LIRHNDSYSRRNVWILAKRNYTTFGFNRSVKVVCHLTITNHFGNIVVIIWIKRTERITLENIWIPVSIVVVTNFDSKRTEWICLIKRCLEVANRNLVEFVCKRTIIECLEAE